jgi:uncharacterized protein YjbI with pentapeptide repeats
MRQDDLKTMLERHRRWLDTGDEEGARAVLAGANLAGQAFWRADLQHACVDRADLTGCNLDHASLYEASCRNARFVRASLWQADLRKADLSNADLRGAKLDHANLQGAILHGTNMTDATFWGARLVIADLRGVTGLTPAQLRNAQIDEETQHLQSSAFLEG